MKALVLASARDTSTAFSAELRGWRYPAEVSDLMILSLLAGDHAKALLPFDIEETRSPKVSEDEVKQALEELDAEIVFTG